MTPSPLSDLILGTAIGYTDKHIQAFALSLRASGYQGKLAVFVDQNSPRLSDFGLDVDFVPIPPYDDMIRAMELNAQRFFLYRYYLSCFSVAGRILLTDMRDVVFQKHPFQFDALKQFDFFYALEDRVIGECDYNSSWIHRRYGNGVFRKLRGEPISCAGTVIGTDTAMRSYLQKMCDHLVGSPSDFGMDQGVHNYVVRLDPIENQCALLNGLGPVMTMHHMNKDLLCFSEAGEILNYNGSAPNIVHQYDRMPPELQQQLSVLNGCGPTLRPY